MNNLQQEPVLKVRQPAILRLWHWSNFIVILCSLSTVIFAKTLLHANNNIEMVQKNLEESNITVTAAQARSVAHDFNDLAWHWHVYFGYFIASLLLFRILFELFRPKDQRLIPLIKKSLGYLKMPAADKARGKHYFMVRCAYLSFYLILFAQACTGLFMSYSDDVESLKAIRHQVSNVHAVLMWFIIAFIVVHIAGVVRAEFTRENRGIVSDMINGGGQDA
ncbi:MAG: cytochrome b/b6 domain-containing protein [Bacteroidia bacterium]|nr:cytochrome b/b6 domain-containing protein [Bacteroidia bacterium]